MWRFVGSVLADALASSLVSFSRASDCTIHLEREPLPGLLTSVLPAPGKDDLAVVWQAGEAIHLQRFGRDCTARGDRVEVNRSQDFWSTLDDSGLRDAATLPSGEVVVAWLLGGDVWVRTLGRGGDSRDVLMANAPSEVYRSRAQVRVVANPAEGGGFVVAWSSWQQDGDGWGVFARFFGGDGLPLGPELQLNTKVTRFQWRPQLAWCGSSVWAIWANGTGVPCSTSHPKPECANGPMLRHITPQKASGGTIVDPPEENMPGKMPLESTVACNQGDGAVVLWLQRGGKELQWTWRHAPHAAPPPRAIMAWGPSEQRPVNASFLQAEAVQAAVRRLGLNLDTAQAADWRPPSADAALRGPAAAVGQVFGASLDGRAAVLADSAGLVVWLTDDARGTLTVQLLDFGTKQAPRAFQPRKLAFGAAHARAAWDSFSDDLALVTCFVVGGEVDTDPEHKSEYVCMRKRVQWLANGEGLGVGGSVALATVLVLILVFCCLRQCSPMNFMNAVRGPGALQPHRNGATTRPRRRSSTRGQQHAQLRELREQLAQIPMVPMPQPQQQQLEPSPPANGGSVAPAADAGAAVAGTAAPGEAPPAASPGGPGGEEARCARTRLSTGDACSICQNEVIMRVALRPCGHTACRDCVTRLVEINLRCHICRGSITGVQPVYL